MTTIYLGLGSNLGDRRTHLRAAVDGLRPVVANLDVSSLYETEPVGVHKQPKFLNVVLRGQTSLEPLELLAFVKHLEVAIGRKPTFRWGPRVIDIDILLYDDAAIERAELVIPHPQLEHRAFVLVPLHELAPTLRLPHGATVSDLLEREGTHDSVELIGPLHFSAAPAALVPGTHAGCEGSTCACS